MPALLRPGAKHCLMVEPQSLGLIQAAMDLIEEAFGMDC